MGGLVGNIARLDWQQQRWTFKMETTRLVICDVFDSVFFSSRLDTQTQLVTLAQTPFPLPQVLKLSLVSARGLAIHEYFVLGSHGLLLFVQ